MQIGLIGAGRHGSRYAEHIRRGDVPGLALAAISRRSEQGREQALAWHSRYHADWRELVRDPRVEAVIAVAPPSLHGAIARLCVEAGKPLLLEKPLAIDAASGAEIVGLCTRAGLPLTVGQTLRYNTIIQGLRRFLPRVGPLYAFSASHRLEPSTLPWLEKPETAGAGVVLHIGVHLFDALRFITGSQISRVQCSTLQIHNPGVEDLFTGQLELACGAVGTADLTKVGRGRSGRYEFVGRDGELHGDQVHGRLEFIEGRRIIPLEHNPPGNTIVPLLRDWLEYLAGKGPNPVSGEEGLAALRACDACLRSARLDGWAEV